MFEIDLSRCGAEETLSFVSSVRALADRAEVRVIEAAAHWADLHGVVQESEPGGSALPGTERLVSLGGDGTPAVAEFAPAEFGAELGMSAFAAARLVGDALDLRHRLPRLWVRVLAGEVKPWVARKTADATRDLSVEVVAVVDRRVSPWAHGLSWGRLEATINAARIEADPVAAQAEADDVARSQGVWVGHCNDHGVKDIFIRAEAPAAIWFDAAVDRIADGLGLLGDDSSKDVRRARAVGVLAQPQHALDLYTRLSTADPFCTGAGGIADGTGAGGSAYGTGASGSAYGTGAGGSAQGTGGGGTQGTGGRGTDRRLDARPPATLYVHVSAGTLAQAAGADISGTGADVSGTGADVSGVARVEEVGAVTVEQARRWLGDCDVTVKPVIDLAGQAPVDGYEVPDRLREAVHLRNPVDVFPYGTNAGRGKDMDHTEAFVHLDEDGPPGQTGVTNLGAMTRFHHRIKTHGRWQVQQPFPGIFIWRSPHGRYFLVDPTGTQRIHTQAA